VFSKLLVLSSQISFDGTRIDIIYNGNELSLKVSPSKISVSIGTCNNKIRREEITQDVLYNNIVSACSHS